MSTYYLTLSNFYPTVNEKVIKMKKKYKFHQEDVDNLHRYIGCPESIESLFKIEFATTKDESECDFTIFRKEGKLFTNKWFYFEINLDDSDIPINAKIMNR